MGEDSCRFFGILIFVGLSLLVLSMLLWVGCFLPNSLVYIAGCFCIGVGLVGDIASLAHLDLGSRDSSFNRRWFRTWPIVWRALMLVGVGGLCLPLLALPPSVNSFNPGSRGLLWYYINFAGGFCLVTGLVASIATSKVRSRLMKDPLPLGRRQDRRGALILLGLVLLTGGLVFVFSSGTPDPSYCGTNWDCDLAGSVTYHYSSNDLNSLSCSSHRYSSFWPPYLNNPSMTPFCPRHFFEWNVPCYCEQNRCVVNYRMFLK